MPLSLVFLSDILLSTFIYDALLLDLYFDSFIELCGEHLKELALDDVLFHVLLDFDNECPLWEQSVFNLMDTAETSTVKFLLEDVAVFE